MCSCVRNWKNRLTKSLKDHLSGSTKYAQYNMWKPDNIGIYQLSSSLPSFFSGFTLSQCLGKDFHKWFTITPHSKSQSLTTYINRVFVRLINYIWSYSVVQKYIDCSQSQMYILLRDSNWILGNFIEGADLEILNDSEDHSQNVQEIRYIPDAWFSR